MAGAILLVALLGVGVAGVAATAHERARAQNAADAAALASALQVDPAAAEVLAAQMAQHNGGALLSWRRSGITTVVRVEVGAQEAVAAARPVTDAAAAAP